MLFTVLLIAPALSGCADLKDIFGSIGAPDADVRVTPLQEGGEWNTDPQFTAQVVFEEPLEVRIEATSEDGRSVQSTVPATEAELQEDGTYVTEVTIDLPDGTWKIVLFVDGHRWTTWQEVAIDATPPEVHGLELQGTASGGAYTIGDGATIDPDGSVTVLRQPGGQVIANDLPHTVTGLGTGIHVFDVVVTDPAGNQNPYTVQVSAGGATPLPAGKHTAGIVARYDNDLRIWDLSDLTAYASLSMARAAAPGHLGDGYQVDPDDPEVQDVVAQEVTSGMNTVEAALALYEWMYDTLEYDVDRLESGESDLQSPSQTIAEGGGVCRDLAALYTSLLRAAGVPARLVTGYLGGDVNGFHAWVEFYGGSVPGNPSPWVVVDVSGIGLSDVEGDDMYSDESMLQSFAIQRPDYLTLRVVDPEAETEGWSTAVSVSYPGDWSRSPEFAKEVTECANCFVEGTLCMDPDAFSREIVSHSPNGDNCDASMPYYFPTYPWRSRQVLDYGLEVIKDEGGTVELTVAYPFEDDQPGSVEFTAYGPKGYRQQWDEVQGTVVLKF